MTTYSNDCVLTHINDLQMSEVVLVSFIWF